MTLLLALLVQAAAFEGLSRQERGTVWTFRRTDESTVTWTLLSKEKDRLTFDERTDDPRAVTVVLARADGVLTLERKREDAPPSAVRLPHEEVGLGPEGITKIGAAALVRVEPSRFVPITLASRYNATLTKAWHPSQVGDGEFNDLSSLPRGVRTLEGVPFDVRGVLQLAGQVARNFPEKAEGLEVKSEAVRLHFLHATGWSVPPSTPIGSFVVRFTDGARAEIPIVYGEDVSDWWQYPQHRFRGGRGKVAWVGSNPACRAQGGALKLYRTAWENPKPDVAIESVDYVSSMTIAAPFLVGLTVEKK